MLSLGKLLFPDKDEQHIQSPKRTSLSQKKLDTLHIANSVARQFRMVVNLLSVPRDTVDWNSVLDLAT